MKNIIKSIQKIKGVTEVVPTQMNMAIVVFEPQNEPILITEDGVPLFNEDDECWWVNPNSMKKGKQLSVFSELENDEFKYFSTKKAAKEFISMQRTCAELHELIEKESIKPISVDLGHLDIFDTLALHAHMSAEKKEKSEPKPEAIKCDTKEQWDFMVTKFDKYTVDSLYFNDTTPSGGLRNCVRIGTASGLSSACEEYYKNDRCMITPFSTFISRESLTSEWEKFLIAEAVKRYPVGTVYYDHWNGIECVAEKLPYFYFNDDSHIASKECGGVIYIDGKWAEIIPSTLAEPKSLTADQLKDGEIIVDQDGAFCPRIIRFNKKEGKRTYIYSQLMNDDSYLGEVRGYRFGEKIRSATLSEAQSLIRAEVANGYFHGLSTEV